MLRSIFDPTSLNNKLEDLTKETQTETFWQDQTNALKINKQIANINRKLKEFNKINDEYEYLFEVVNK